VATDPTLPRDRASRTMAWAFGIGSACFLVGPIPVYLALVGPTLDALTFFVGSLLFTLGGALQTGLASPTRHVDAAGRAAWWAAVIQSAGTLFFNVTTFRALQVTLSNPHYDRLVWRPDAFGSVCFLVSGAIAYQASARRGWLPVRSGSGWWQPVVNLLGCVFFGISAIAGYVVGSSTEMVDQAAANATTAIGAACFLACAVGSGRHVRTTAPSTSI
jgi:FtsH-binding integral membrane protein